MGFRVSGIRPDDLTVWICFHIETKVFQRERMCGQACGGGCVKFRSSLLAPVWPCYVLIIQVLIAAPSRAVVSFDAMFQVGNLS